MRHGVGEGRTPGCSESFDLRPEADIYIADTWYGQIATVRYYGRGARSKWYRGHGLGSCTGG